MKRFAFVIAASCAAVLALSSCAGTYQKGNKSPETTSAQIDTVSYALGMYFGKMITSSPFGEIDLAQLRKGFNDVLNEKDVMLDETRLGVIIQTHLMTQQAYRALENLKEGEDFLAANKEKEGVVETESGLQYEVLRKGSGATPRIEDVVTVNYTGKLMDGSVFESTYEAKQPARFVVMSIIPGLEEGLKLMKEGAQFRFTIPANLAYGEFGAGQIPPESPLVFELELIKVEKVGAHQGMGKTVINGMPNPHK